MKIENTTVYGFKPALRGMRNPKNSWAKSDSFFYSGCDFHNHETRASYSPTRYIDLAGTVYTWEQLPTELRGECTRRSWDSDPEHKIKKPEMCIIGPKDMKLATSLIKGGSEHRKFLRQIMIWMDITIPRYVWQELDTYKVATVRNSCSTMHKLSSRDLEQSDFEQPIDSTLLHEINQLGAYIRTIKLIKEEEERKQAQAGLPINEALRQMKNILPEGFLQRATYSLNYETALIMFHQRKNHRLPEWNVDSEGSICSWILSLPYMKEWTQLKK